ncbi:MAG: hypothetical protein JWP68_1606, partial [Modestobacter sp.]|nr:hypothetical protein [Modestobacter sp.]
MSTSEPSPTSDPVAPPPSAEESGQMSRREVFEALSGLLLGMFV